MSISTFSTKPQTSSPSCATAAISCLFWAADAIFGADEEIDVDDAAYSFSVAIKKVQFEGEDVFWNGSASLLFENLPEQAKIADVMEDEDLRATVSARFHRNGRG